MLPSLLLILLAAAPAGAEVPPPVTDEMYVPVDPAEAALGRLLFWDPILSGNRNISCGTCHHPRFGTSDGVSLDIGEGGVGVGPARDIDPSDPPEQRVPRNAPALFNLGAREFTRLFHDGRIEADPSRPSGLRTPLEDEMVRGFSGVLSAQTMFPVVSPDEMAGHYGENEVSKAVRTGRITGPGGAWDLIARRVEAVPEYADTFASVYPHVADGAPIAFTDISNAVAAFVAAEWRSDHSPFDAHLRGEKALDGPAARGMTLFYGSAGCARCHSGPFLTDHDFHAMGQPQFGPGKAARFESHHRDTGRMRVTGRDEDAYRFRTPSLRNVALTAPYGHDGAFPTLQAFLRHHLDPVAAEVAPAPLLPRGDLFDDLAPLGDVDERRAIAAAVTTPPLHLPDGDIADLLAFLGALTDPSATASQPPDRVPSGLPVDR